jgi:hypothetical protein
VEGIIDTYTLEEKGAEDKTGKKAYGHEIEYGDLELDRIHD